MLLVVDVGNTNTVLGVYDGERSVGHWRIETRKNRTGDEYAALLREMFALSKLTWHGITAGIIATVVPPVLFSLEEMFERHLQVKPLVVGSGIKTGMQILCDNPREVGADRIVNGVAAFERFKQGCIVVDFGTATTFDLVTPKGEYAGGAIAPGIGISADALYHAASKLPRVEITRPKSVVGKNTVHSMQAGLFFGYVGLIDELVRRMTKEAGFAVRVIATGGLAPLFTEESAEIEIADELLTLTGLRILHARNA